MSKLVDYYLTGLLSRYSNTEQKDFSQRSAVDEEDLEQLSTYFQLPLEFVDFLRAIGTSNDSEVPLFYFNEDEFKLLPIQSMIEAAQTSGYVTQPRNLENLSKEKMLEMRQDDELDAYMDDAINPLALNKDWLLFAENAQGSKLFIDFKPGFEGKEGQIVGYFKDQDFYYVLAESFKELLEVQADTKIPYYRVVLGP